MVFALRQLQEKCIEQHQDLYIMFVDLTKAFDTVSRPALWAILSRLGCPPKFVRMIRAFHEGMMARVIENGDVSDPFPVSNGVKQGCVLAPTLFSLIFSVMLSSALSGSDDGILIRFRTDGKFYDLRRLQARTKVKEALIHDLLFADDCAIAAPSEAALQRLAVRLSSATKAFGLTISIKKTEVLCQPAPKTTTSAPHITNSIRWTTSVTLVAICLQMAVLIRRLHAGYQKPADLLVVCRVGCGEHVGSRPKQRLLFTEPLCYLPCCTGVRPRRAIVGT